MGEERDYQQEQEQLLFNSMREKLNEEQVTYFNAIVAAVEQHEQDPH